MRQHSGIGVLDKAMGVLHAVAEQPCSLTELCNRTGLPRATAHRLAVGLEVHRLLTRDADGLWCTGPASASSPRPRATPSSMLRRSSCRGSARSPEKAFSSTGARGPTGVHRVDGAARRPARHGARRRATADDRRFGRQGPSRMGGRPDPTRHPARASFGERVLVEVRRRGWRRARPNASPAWPVSRRPSGMRRATSSRRSRCRDRSIAWAAAPARWAADLLAAADALHKRL